MVAPVLSHIPEAPTIPSCALSNIIIVASLGLLGQFVYFFGQRTNWVQ